MITLQVNMQRGMWVEGDQCDKVWMCSMQVRKWEGEMLDVMQYQYNYSVSG
jgi:hypothetical protein